MGNEQSPSCCSFTHDTPGFSRELLFAALSGGSTKPRPAIARVVRDPAPPNDEPEAVFDERFERVSQGVLMGGFDGEEKKITTTGREESSTYGDRPDRHAIITNTGRWLDSKSLRWDSLSSPRCIQ
jgi:hypothetical protein